MYDTERQSEPAPNNSVIQEEPQKPSDSSGADIVYEDTNEDDVIQNTEPEKEFKLKNETEYIQLRLSVTSSEGKRDDVEEYLKQRLNIDTVEDNLGNSYLASPRDTYDAALSAIIDCPYTENVVYKNEDYYPVACEIFNGASTDGNLTPEAIEYIENIEKMCKDIIITIN